MIELKNLTPHKSERWIKLKKLERSLKRLRVIAIVGILICLLMCVSCSTVNNERLQEQCLSYVATYGDIVECAIKLNEVQK